MIRTESGTPIWQSGQGPTVILGHGVLVDHRMWVRQIAALSPHYRVCAFDMLGHGQAPDPPGARTLADFVDQLAEVVRRVSEAGPPVVCGYSMSGLIAQAYAVGHHEELAGLVVMSSVHDRSPEEAARVIARSDANRARGVDNAIESGTRRWFRAEERARHADLMAEVAGWMGDGDFAAKCKAHAVFARSDGAVTGKLGAISCPALVMTGADDSGSTPEMARKMAAALPDAELEIFAGQHHLLPLLDAPQVNARMIDFLQRRVWR